MKTASLQRMARSLRLNEFFSGFMLGMSSQMKQILPELKWTTMICDDPYAPEASFDFIFYTDTYISQFTNAREDEDGSNYEEGAAHNEAVVENGLNISLAIFNHKRKTYLRVHADSFDGGPLFLFQYDKLPSDNMVVLSLIETALARLFAHAEIIALAIKAKHDAVRIQD